MVEVAQGIRRCLILIPTGQQTTAQARAILREECLPPSRHRIVDDRWSSRFRRLWSGAALLTSEQAIERGLPLHLLSEMAVPFLDTNDDVDIADPSRLVPECSVCAVA